MLLVPYTSKKRVFTEGPNTYFCVGKDGPSVPNSLRKSDFYVRIVHPHACSCLRRTHIKMEIQKKIQKRHSTPCRRRRWIEPSGAATHGSAHSGLGGGGIDCHGANRGGSGCCRPPSAARHHGASARRSDH